MVILALRGTAAAEVHVDDADGDGERGALETPGDLTSGAVALD